MSTEIISFRSVDLQFSFFTSNTAECRGVRSAAWHRGSAWRASKSIASRRSHPGEFVTFSSWDRCHIWCVGQAALPQVVPGAEPVCLQAGMSREFKFVLKSRASNVPGVLQAVNYSPLRNMLLIDLE